MLSFEIKWNGFRLPYFKFICWTFPLMSWANCICLIGHWIWDMLLKNTLCLIFVALLIRYRQAKQFFFHQKYHWFAVFHFVFWLCCTQCVLSVRLITSALTHPRTTFSLFLDVGLLDRPPPNDLPVLLSWHRIKVTGNFFCIHNQLVCVATTFPFSFSVEINAINCQSIIQISLIHFASQRRASKSISKFNLLHFTRHFWSVSTSRPTPGVIRFCRLIQPFINFACGRVIANKKCWQLLQVQS